MSTRDSKIDNRKIDVVIKVNRAIELNNYITKDIINKINNWWYVRMSTIFF